jgi:hypothetical protein
MMAACERGAAPALLGDAGDVTSSLWTLRGAGELE